MKMRDIVGNNRSGALRVPEMTRELIAAAEEFPPSSEGDADEIAAVRVAYAQNGEPAATMPPPLGVLGLAKNALGALRGDPNLLLDKLGERLAYERSGVRLYDALLSKVDAYGTFRGGPSRDDVTHIRDEELEHFHLLAQTIERLGGDPTAVTPSANVQAVASRGMCAVLVDPRTNLLQSLEIVQMIELADNDCWAALIELAQGGGDAEAVEAFGEALEHEREHLERVRAWVAAGQGRSSDGAAGAREASVRTPSKRTSAGGTRARPKRATSGARRATTKRASTRGRSKAGGKSAKTSKAATGRGKGKRSRRATGR
jgi:hypothetical protein